MSDATLLLRIEAKKKSGALAAAMNLVVPGAGYAYCGRWILGIIAFFLIVGMWLVSAGLATIPIWLLLIVDGFLCAGRYNKKMIEAVLLEEAGKAAPAPKAA